MSARSARAASLGSPASQGAMSAFQQRLTPLLLRPCSARSAASSAETTPMSAGLQRAASSPASPLMAGTPASLGRMLRHAASGPGGGGPAGEQLSRILACYQEQQALAASAGEAAAAARSAEKPLLRNDSSMQQAAEHQVGQPATAERAPSAAVQHKRRANRPPTPTSRSGDFKIAAYRGGGAATHSRGPSPSGDAGSLYVLNWFAASRPLLAALPPLASHTSASLPSGVMQAAHASPGPTAARR